MRVYIYQQRKTHLPERKQEEPGRKKILNTHKMCCKQCSFTCVSLSIFLLYVIVLAQTLVTLIWPGGLGGFDYDTPLSRTGKKPKLYTSLWKENSLIDVAFYLSVDKNPIDGKSLDVILKKNYKNDHDTISKKHYFIFKKERIKFTYGEDSIIKNQVNLTKNIVSSKLWKKMIKGKSYLHGVVYQHGYSPNTRSKNHNPYYVKHYSFFMGKNREYIKTQKLHRLFSFPLPYYSQLLLFGSSAAEEGKNDDEDDSSFFCGDPTLSLEKPAIFDNSSSILSANERKPHWTPSLSFKIVTDFTKYPENQIPPLIANKMRIKEYEYLPFTFVDSVGLTSDKYIPLNNTVKVLPLEITFEPSGIGRWQMGLQMEESFKMLHQNMGARDKESDEMRSMLTETHPTLLLVTLVVTLLHTLFDVLAFKSDIDFWRKLKSKRGLSARSQVTSLICQIVVIAYLQNEKGSLLILIPSAFGVILQIWKVQKMLCSKSLTENTLEAQIKADDDGNNNNTTTTNNNSNNNKEKKKNKKDDQVLKKKHNDKIKKLKESLKEEQDAVEKTKFYDNMAGVYLGEILYPLVIGSVIHSAFCQGHTSYYSWFISSAVYAVYTFGFIIMTPQLFINYKLKSVAHLPWKFFMYRALNTFIDDLFAFIIKMPTAHRLSCFRDDIVFFIFLYQRWIYPVDMSRISVGVDGEEIDDVDNSNKKDEKQIRSGSTSNDKAKKNVIADDDKEEERMDEMVVKE